ncbi:MAG TPA: protein phosphatase 2C domain-containing protein [Candidatus Methylacidiphilales bacterium]|jgi:protein phosphatase|nr:protein phosphatase 2C domain-containing protein [Candidatus Methylacidiphilales bacterium]
MDHPRNVSDVRRLQWSGHTDRGHVRSNNEDSFLALRFNAQELDYLGKVGDAPTGPHDYVFAVSDGMGGAHAGEFASRITVDKITHLLPRSFKHSALGMDAGFEDIFEELFAQVHKALVFVGDSDEEIHGMQATLSLCWFTPGWLYFAHIGDSRIYYLPKGAGEMKQLSHDDTFVGWLQRTGQINEREARHHPRRTALQKALGGGNQFVDPHVGAVATEPGDQFLLCTDGLTEGLYDYQLFELLRHPDVHACNLSPARRLVEASLERAGKDNTTAVVVEMG